MVQQGIKKWQKSTIFCRGLIYQAQFFEPCPIVLFFYILNIYNLILLRDFTLLKCFSENFSGGFYS